MGCFDHDDYYFHGTRDCAECAKSGNIPLFKLPGIRPLNISDKEAHFLFDEDPETCITLGTHFKKKLELSFPGSASVEVYRVLVKYAVRSTENHAYFDTFYMHHYNEVDGERLQKHCGSASAEPGWQMLNCTDMRGQFFQHAVLQATNQYQLVLCSIEVFGYFKAQLTIL